LAFLGRCSPEKGVLTAIEVAKRTENRLKIATRINAPDAAYFEQMVKPQLDHPLIELCPEVGGAEKEQFLQNAKGLLFPIDWEEPFGLVMIEALAAGTPVLAFKRGSVPEVISDGLTGFLSTNLEQMCIDVRRLSPLSRAVCRAEFERRFSVERMTTEYLSVYQELIKQHSHRRRATVSSIRISKTTPQLRDVG
jgi:glycosyltransferase involved in cell wall biosynthesis